MGSISLRDVSFIASIPLFSNLTLVIGETDRLGLVAGNGAGKTTLLKCLAGLAEPTSGEIVRSRGMRVGMVEQDMSANLLDLTLAEAVRRALPPAEREAESWRVDVVLDEFETPADLRDRPVKALSGGWQRLALIARAWITQPDALLLDEPTNHLDLAKIQLLERWIESAAGRVPLVIASHDRQFLDAATTRTLFLRPETSRSFAHPFTRARRLLKEEDAAEEARQANEAKEAQRLRRNAAELKDIGINSGSDLLQKKSMQLKERAEKIEQKLKPQHVERSGDIRLANRGTHARVLASLDDVAVTAPDGTPLFRTGKLSLLQGDRVVVLGRNGVGKSQLVKLLHRAATGGAVAGVRLSPSVVLAYVDQHMSQLPAKETPFGFIAGTFRLGDQRSRGLLAGAGFPVDRQEKPISQFSPGQKARLGLLALRLAEPNFYLMDEPTTHVDIPGQETLEAEILAHEATCLVVSHDRSFVRAIGTRFLLIDGKKIKEIDAPEEFYATLTV